MNVGRQLSNLVLIGFMGTGKSAVGRLVAEQLKFQFVDTDDFIESRTGKSISEIFNGPGESVFRELERQLVLETAGWRKTVIATGGGLGANEANLASLREHALIVCLWASVESIWRRVGGQDHRPLLHGPDPMEKIRVLLEARTPFYRQADVLVNTNMRSIREVAHHVLHQFHSARAQLPQ